MKKIIIILIILFSFIYIDTIKAQTVSNNYENALDIDIDNSNMTCTEILGPTLTSIVRQSITIIQVAGAIIAIVNGMLILLPAVIAKDADALKKASKTLVNLAIVLSLIIIFKPFVRLIGHILEYDISCIM